MNSRFVAGWRAALALVALGAGACSTADQCSPEVQNLAVLDLFEDWYLWREALPEVDETAYATSAELVDALRYRVDGQVVDRWSGVSDAAERSAYYEQGAIVDYGWALGRAEDGRVRVLYVTDGTSASEEGVRRGDTLLAIDGVTVADIDEGGLWEQALGPNEEGYAIEVDLESPQGDERAVTLTKTPAVVDTVPVAEVLEASDGARVGYLLFQAFIEPSEPALRAAFADFVAAEVTAVVVDLRYNGGGLLSVAELLASLLAPERLEGELLVELTFNDAHTDSNDTLRFTREEASLDVDRVIFLTGFGTASASETVMRGLDAQLGVTLVGSTTRGKPVAAGTFERCDEAITLITSRMVYADGPGEYYEGIAPDCSAGDDLDHDLGDPAEGRLAAALGLLAGEPCPSADKASDSAADTVRLLPLGVARLGGGAVSR